MKIKILGTRGKIEAQSRKHIKHSGILIDEKILLDVGEKDFLNYRPQSIFFTHLHPDHAWFIETNENFVANVPTFVPESNPLIKNAKIISSAMELGEFKITPIPTIHSLLVKSQGYLVESKHKKVFYSGDMVWIEKKYHSLLQNLDLVITDGSTIKKAGMIRRKDDRIFGHNGIPDLINFFKKFTGHIIFTHFGTWFMKDVAEGKRKINELEPANMKIEVAYDGKEYII
jgi:ribonuclease BN (tRNA processing enzyme)